MQYHILLLSNGSFWMKSFGALFSSRRHAITTFTTQKGVASTVKKAQFAFSVVTSEKHKEIL